MSETPGGAQPGSGPRPGAGPLPGRGVGPAPTGNGWPGSDYRPPPPPMRTQPPPVQPPRPQPPRPPAAPPGTATRPVTVAPSARKGGRRARLVVKRIDPWSTLKFAFVYSLAGMLVLVVAAVALYAIVDAMGVIDSIRNFLVEIEGKNSTSSIADWLGFGRVLTVTLVIGVVNVILFTAFATLTAFIYNVCTDLVGGVEVTLTDRG